MDPDQLRASLGDRFDTVRARTLDLARPLSPEDQCVQSMPDASPTKWHLAHTTWFFETLVLAPHAPEHRTPDPRYAYCFNSYYESLGPRQPRPQRGLLTRPSAAEVLTWREQVDASVRRLLARAPAAVLTDLAPVFELGLHHEEQHQELLLTDALHLLAQNPLAPVYHPAGPTPRATRDAELRWARLPGGRTAIGHDGQGFAFDNEEPRHDVWLAPFEITTRPVSNAEYLDFVRDGGYRDPLLWLSEGWAQVQTQGWRLPPYWRGDDGEVRAGRLRQFTLMGEQPLDPDAPVAPLSWFEAAAFAAWAGARLPTEFEWEAACRAGVLAGRGQVWEWTRSAYDPYPGFRPRRGVAAEYNGKFMVGQLVLRGGSVASPPGHVRTTYRNFFPPAARWQFSGLRLARDAA